MANDKDERIDTYTDDEIVEELVPKIELPKQRDFFRIPRRFGSIPVDESPLGYDSEKQYYKIYPRISLPFQRANRVRFGHPNLDPNRLFWGDNLHVMRMLDSSSIDLIYIDPPFFSGRQYNEIFGDQNEIRSFSDIWEGGMSSYLVWLNARLLEMKRLLKNTGSIFVHLDWHAVHYVKIELDKIFSYDNFRNEIVWCYTGGGYSKFDFGKKHDVILRYSKSDEYLFYSDQIRVPYNLDPTKRTSPKAWGSHNDKIYKPNEAGKIPEDWWVISPVNSQAKERIGYPTQKPRELLERIILSSTKKGDVVADFFCGGGTTPAIAQENGRKWIACDQSRVAVAITQGRLESLFADGKRQTTFTEIPDISIEYWGTYEVPELEELDNDQFRDFIISAYGGRPSTVGEYIHGFKKETPIFVGSPKQDSQVTKYEVINFAQEISEKKGKKQGIMLAWSFSQSARTAVEKLIEEKGTSVDLIQILLTEIESSEFRSRITKLHADYDSFLKFILPPEVRVHHKKLNAMTYEFDSTESIALNVGAKIINIQWDLDYKGRFTPTKGFAYGRDQEHKPLFKIEYKFEYVGKRTIACRVQDDLGGEKIYTEVISVS